MKLVAPLLTLVAGFQLALAQDVTDCTDISVDLGTTPITPVTGMMIAGFALLSPRGKHACTQL